MSHVVGMVWLVISIPLKNMNVSWNYYSQYIFWKIKNAPNHQPVNYGCEKTTSTLWQFYVATENEAFKDKLHVANCDSELMHMTWVKPDN